jgi:4-hydroxy-3-polyprenylbenzoate decarboxylase
MTPQRLIVGVSGASGVAYAVRLLKALQPTPIETHLVISKAGVQTLSYETDLDLDGFRALADKTYPAGDIAAPISSGSFRTMGMIVIPCSIRTLSEIAAGTTDNLLTRAGDVVLKERRRLVLVVRETPLHLGHLRRMAEVTEMGAVVMPPVPAFYMRPKTIDDLIDHTVARALDLFDIDLGLAPRWGDSDESEQ